MKTWQHISVSPIAGALGAEVAGVHLGELGDDAFNEVRAAFVEHQVLFFRDQEITRDQHKAFARRFGTLQIHPYLQQLKNEGHPEFVVLQSDEKHPYLAEAWHSDVTFVNEPPLGSVLAMRGGAGVWRRHDVGEHVRGLRGAVGQDAAHALGPDRDSRYRRAPSRGWAKRPTTSAARRHLKSYRPSILLFAPIRRAAVKDCSLIRPSRRRSKE